METSLKQKYSTKELKQDIIDVGDVVLQNSDRIKRIEACVGEFSDHAQRHIDVFDPKLNRLDIIMFGEKGDDGIISELRNLKTLDKRFQKLEDSLNKVMWVVIIAVLGAILKIVIIG